MFIICMFFINTTEYYRKKSKLILKVNSYLSLLINAFLAFVFLAIISVAKNGHCVFKTNDIFRRNEMFREKGVVKEKK